MNCYLRGKKKITHNRYAIAVLKQIHAGRELVVGHLPLTRNFKIFMVHNYHGAVISVKVVDVNR